MSALESRERAPKAHRQARVVPGSEPLKVPSAFWKHPQALDEPLRRGCFFGLSLEIKTQLTFPGISTGAAFDIAFIGGLLVVFFRGIVPPLPLEKPIVERQSDVVPNGARIRRYFAAPVHADVSCKEPRTYGAALKAGTPVQLNLF